MLHYYITTQIGPSRDRSRFNGSKHYLNSCNTKFPALLRYLPHDSIALLLHLLHYYMTALLHTLACRDIGAESMEASAVSVAALLNLADQGIGADSTAASTVSIAPILHFLHYYITYHITQSLYYYIGYITTLLHTLALRGIGAESMEASPVPVVALLHSLHYCITTLLHAYITTHPGPPSDRS